MPTIKTGIENLIENPRQWISGERIGLLCNPASVNRNFTHTRLLVNRIFPGQLKALYSPQHGFFAEKQDNMIESGDLLDPELNIPVFSLYGETRIPDSRMFDPIDILLVDLQDVGTRVYTFIYTLSYCLESERPITFETTCLTKMHLLCRGQRDACGSYPEPAPTAFVVLRVFADQPGRSAVMRRKLRATQPLIQSVQQPRLKHSTFRHLEMRL